MAPHSLHSDERGFTLVEVMAAILILLVGVLGTVALIDGANAGTTTASDRVGAANLARELVEGARASDYAKLDNSTVVSELRKQPALTGVSSGGWKITRRGVDYTVTATACTYDDAKDGVLNATPAAGYCSNSPTAPVGDKNGDDFRRVVFTVAWQLNGRTRTLQQTTLIPNPSGGLGPRVVSLVQPLTVVQPGSPSVTSCVQATTHVVHLDATTTFADSVHWNTDSPGSEENATQNSNTSWSINWDLDTPPVGTAAGVPPVVDGTYTLNAQAFDDRGIPGDIKAATVMVNRSCARQPTGFVAGWDKRSSTDYPNGVIDFEWNGNPEHDVVGYRVYWLGPDGSPGGGDDQLVCPSSGTTPVNDLTCFAKPPVTTFPQAYMLVPVDLADIQDSSTLRESDKHALATVTDSGSDAPYFPADTTLAVQIVDGFISLSWDKSAVPATGRHIIFYRIYRDGPPTDFANRYDRTVDPTKLDYTDSDSSSGSHSYWVTAVDDTYNESGPISPDPVVSP